MKVTMPRSRKGPVILFTVAVVAALIGCGLCGGPSGDSEVGKALLGLFLLVGAVVTAICSLVWGIADPGNCNGEHNK